jgi:FkbM family methyltransferase
VPLNTYAQNFEDIMLWRALGDVQQGFYIDIGAQDPNFDSVSKLFHERGWRGIHVDASPDYCEMLRRERPGDLVLQAVIGESTGLVDFFVFPVTGISTAVGALASQYREAGWQGERTQVPALTLDSILETAGVDEVHWLKIDVEGFERQVLDGWQRRTIQPWIVVIEAIAPFSRTLTHESFEANILAKGYHFVYFDGLNRYYVSDDHAELDRHFEFGPSLWDEMQVTPLSRMAQSLIEEHDRKISELHDHAHGLHVSYAELHALKVEVETHLGGQLAQEQAAAAARLRETESAMEVALAEVAAQREIASRADEARREAEAATVAALAEAAAQREAAIRSDEHVRQTEASLTQARIELAERKAELAESQERNRDYRAQLERHVTLLAEIEARAIKERSDSEARVRELQRQIELLGAEAVDRQTRIDALAAEREALVGPALGLDELSARGEREFILAAYLTLLGRSADPAGMRHYLERLAAGQPRQEILADLYWSSEGQAFNAPLAGRARLVRRRRFRVRSFVSGRRKPHTDPSRLMSIDGPGQTMGSPAAGADLTDVERVRALLSLSGRDFLVKAYEAVLGRGLDPSGESYYMGRMSAGDERIAILTDLRWSDEGRSRGTPSDAIALATDWYRWRRVPLVGAWLRSRTISQVTQKRADRISSMMLRLDHVERELGAISSEGLKAHLGQIESSFLKGEPIVGGWTGALKHVAAAAVPTTVEAPLPPAAQAESVGATGPSLPADERVVFAEHAIRELLPEYAPTGKAEAGTIICSSTPPSETSLRPNSIWFAVGVEPSTLGICPDLPANVALIATETDEVATQIINLGVGVPVRAVGYSDMSQAENPDGWHCIAAKLAGVMEGLAASAEERGALAASKPFRLGVVTSWNEKCGIFIHSAELASAFPDADVRIYAARRDELTAPDGPNVHRFWQMGKERNGFSDIVTHLRRSPVDLLVIQFNYAFFNHEELNRLMIDAAKFGIAVVLILHSTTDPTNALNWRLADLKGGIMRSARVIGHSQHDVERLVKFGVKEKVLLLPLGVAIRTPPARRSVRAEPVLATFGFCFPNKGLVEFINAIGILRDRGIMVRARMINSLHPAEVSKIALNAMHEAVKNLDLSDRVQIISDYLELEEAEKLIGEADLLVNPYQQTGESASASVRQGIRMGVPTLVTPLSLFDDLGGAVFRTSGLTPHDIAGSIERVLEQLRNDGSEAQQVKVELEKWLAIHDFRSQAARLAGICRATQADMLIRKAEFSA